jgi:acetyl esterase
MVLRRGRQTSVPTEQPRGKAMQTRILTSATDASGTSPEGAPCVLDAHASAFLAAERERGPVPTDVEGQRVRFARAQREHVLGLAATKVEECRISADLSVLIFRPVHADDELPIVFYLHGGGWAGGAETHERLVREIAAGVPAAVVFHEYGNTLARANAEQGYALLSHICGSAEALGLDASRLALAADDVGAAAAAAVSLLAKRRRGPEIAFQLLLCPILGEPFSDEADGRCCDGPWLAEGSIRRRLDALGLDPSVASPLRAPIQQLNDLPPALIITAECDPLREQGEAFVRRLVEAGVDATAVRCNGTIHDFMVLNALATSLAALGAVAQAIAALRAALQGS